MKFSSLLGAISQLFLHQLPITSITQVLFWGIATKVKMVHLIDVAWCFQHLFSALGIVSRNFTDWSALTQFKNQVYLAFVVIWVTRLAGFLLATRIFKEYKELRYEDLAKSFKRKSLYFFFQFQGQGLLALTTSLPLYYLFNQDSKFHANNLIGLGMAAVGIVGEAIADRQLYNYKEKNKEKNENHSKVYRGGFFKKARHPNLFFELVIWTGFATAALDMNNLTGTAWAFVGPVALWAIMNFVTIPVTTKQMKNNKPGYDKVINETNKFIPI